MLHLLAKERVQNAFLNANFFNLDFEYRSYCPKNEQCKYVKYDDCYSSKRKHFNLKEFYDRCAQEIAYDGIKRRSDLKLYSSTFPQRPPIYIEFCVTNASEKQKLHSRNCSIAYAAKTIRKRVFDGLVIDLTYYGEYGNVSLLSELVIYLGGKITRDSPDVTHFIISQSNVKQFRRPKKIEGKLIQFFSVNSKWLFDCYFNLKRMDEGLFEYKVVL